jgi:hypothetical protein
MENMVLGAGQWLGQVTNGDTDATGQCNYWQSVDTPVFDLSNYLAQLLVFLTYYCFVVYHYNSLINGSVKLFLIVYLIFMFLRPIGSLVILLIKMNVFGQIEAHWSDLVTAVRIQVDQYIIDLCNLLFYFVLFKMKKIEIQFNPKYNSTDEVIYHLVRFINFARLTIPFILLGFAFKITVSLYIYISFGDENFGDFDDWTHKDMVAIKPMTYAIVGYNGLFFIL